MERTTPFEIQTSVSSVQSIETFYLSLFFKGYSSVIMSLNIRLQGVKTGVLKHCDLECSLVKVEPEGMTLTKNASFHSFDQ
jgi:hypothetical protein